MRGHLLTTTGTRLEDTGIHDFLDVVYAYVVNSPEHRGEMRSSILKYMFDIHEETETNEDMTFEGFSKSAMSMLDELDSFEVG